MSNQIATGYYLGDGAAHNVELGFVPDYVKIINITDQTIYWEWVRGKTLTFTTGATAFKAGDTLVGHTSGATVKVRDVLLTSGTFAAGNAAGFILYNAEDQVGTFQSENLDLGTSKTNVTTATVAAIATDGTEATTKTDTAVATVTASTGITEYNGAAATTAKGFSYGAPLSTTGKLFRWVALR